MRPHDVSGYVRGLVAKGVDARRSALAVLKSKGVKVDVPASGGDQERVQSVLDAMKVDVSEQLGKKLSGVSLATKSDPAVSADPAPSKSKKK